MRKKLIGIAVMAAIAVTAGWNFSQSKNEVAMSDLALANVDALANDESGSGDPCYKGGYDSSLPEATKCAHPCTTERCGGATDKCY